MASLVLTKAITRSWLRVDFVTEWIFFVCGLRLWSFRGRLHLSVGRSLRHSLATFDSYDLVFFECAQQ